jgi:hypothetical protein
VAGIDFSFFAENREISASPEPLQNATSLNLGNSTILFVSRTGAGDASGLVVDDVISVSPTNIVFGAAPGGSVDVVKSWTTRTNNTFTETLTTVTRIDRGTPNAITVTLTGTLAGPGFGGGPAGLAGTPVTMIVNAIQINDIFIVRCSNMTAPPPWWMRLLRFLFLAVPFRRR